MPKINVYLPDELAEAVRETGLPVSAICQRALEQAVRRVTAIRETSLGELSSGDLEERFPLMTGRTRTVLALAVERARASAARAAAAGTGAASPAPSGDVIGSATSALVADTTDAVASAFVKDATDAVASAFVDDATDSVASTLVADATKVAGSASIAVGTGDLLGAMIQEGGNLALHVLRALEVEPSALLRELDRDGVAEPPGPGDGVHFSIPSAGALELSVTEATGLGHNYVGCEHLLLGLVGEPDGAAGRILRAAGAEPRLTRRAVASALAGYVHLRANTAAAAGYSQLQAGSGGAPAATADPGRLLADALQPLIARIERLEQRLPAGGE